MRKHSFETVAGCVLGALLLVLQSVQLAEAADHMSGKKKNGFYVGIEAGISKPQNFRIDRKSVV